MSKPHPSVASAHVLWLFWKLKIKYQSHDLKNDIIDRHFFYKKYKCYKLQLHAVCGSWDTRGCVKDRFGFTSRVDSGQLEKPEYWLHKTFWRGCNSLTNANCRSNLQEMLAECSTAFPDIQENYLFLALYISKINRRIKSFNKKWKCKRS